MSPEGVILVEKNHCIGCLMCFIACPFGAIEEIRGTMGACSVSKCDLCTAIDREPACVAACPTKALSFEDPDSFSKSKRVKYLVEMSASPELISA
jgi:carbon-monoxide dehydrogenase iron sulfur subunit